MVFSQLHSVCPNVLALVDLVLSIPAASTDAERGFNHMKLIKNDWRSRLKDSNLTNLMHILLNSDLVESFNPTSAVHLWNSSSSRARRITKKLPKIPKHESQSESEIDKNDVNEVQNETKKQENERQVESQEEEENLAENEDVQVDIVGDEKEESLSDEESEDDEDYFSDFSDKDAEEEAFDTFCSVDID